MSDFKQRFKHLDAVGFGGAPLGDMFKTIAQADAAATLQAAWDGGIRYYDTAPHYGAGLSEQRFGHFLADKPRDKYVLSSKIGRVLEPSDAPGIAPPFVNGLYFQRRVDYGYEAALQSVHDSLQRLGTGHLDIVYIHDLAPDHLGDAWEEQFDIAMKGAAVALTELREAGHIGAWGLGVNCIEPCLRALDEAQTDVFLLATQYDLLNPAGSQTLFPRCQEQGVGIVAGAPFGSGLLAGGDHYHYDTPADAITERRDQMAAICKRYGVDLKAAALQFTAFHPAVTSVIPGASRPSRIADNQALMAESIPVDVWAEFKAQGLLPESAVVPT